MNQSLADLIAILAKKNPEIKDILLPPASDADIASLEEILEVSLPPDFIAALKICNGQQGNKYGVFNGHIFLSCAKIAKTWKMWNSLLEGGDFNDRKSSPDAGVRQDWWNPRWVPFTSNGSGDHFCLDMSPDSGGVKGQIIFVWHDMSERQNISNSFSCWLSELCATKGDK